MKRNGRTLKLSALIGGLVLSISCSFAATSIGATNALLTTAADILSLTATQAARGILVSVTGVVTLSEANWGGRFFVQDRSGGVFVNNEKDPRPAPGDLVRVSGITHAGGYAPDILLPQWEKLGTAPLPEANPISAEQFMSGAPDGLRVEVSGVVRSAIAEERGTRLVLELASAGYRFRAFLPSSTNVNPDSLVGATVRVRGTAAASFNAQQRRILTMAMFAPQKADFIVDQLSDVRGLQETVTPPK